MENPKFNITIVFKDSKKKSLVIKNCTEYGTSNGGGSCFFYGGEEFLGKGDLRQNIQFINLSLIKNIEIFKTTKFSNHNELQNYIKSGLK